MTESGDSLKERAISILIFLAIIWGVYIADLLIPIEFTRFGLVPRTLSGLVGIGTMTLLHGGFNHVLSNTIPLVMLLGLLAGSRLRFWSVVFEITIAGGFMLWLMGRPSIHVGASLLIFGLISYLIVMGILERKIVSMLVAVLVFFFFGSSLFFGVLPIGNKGVSWEGHLFGAIAGGLVAYLNFNGVTSEKTLALQSPDEI